MARPFSSFDRTTYFQRPKEKEFEHIGFGFERSTCTQPSDYIINSQWVSEETDQTPPFLARRYRPWPFEFHGARFWPYGTVENFEQQQQQHQQQQHQQQQQQQQQQIFRNGWLESQSGDEEEQISPNSIQIPSRPITLRPHTAPCSVSRTVNHTDPETLYQTHLGLRRHAADRSGMSTGSNLYFSDGSGLKPDVRANAVLSRQSEDYTLTPIQNSHNASYGSRYCRGDLALRSSLHEDRFSSRLPRIRGPPYMNFVNMEWIP